MNLAKYVDYCGLNAIGCCFKSRKGFMPGPVYDGNESKTEEIPLVLDTSLMGNECVILKEGRRICGTGAALANVDIVQDKSYFEIRIQSTGKWALGVATKSCDLNLMPLGKDEYSWVLRSGGSLMHANIAVDNITLDVCEGDYFGCSFDHVELNFFHNGKSLNAPIRGIKGTVRPVVCVDDGCIIDISFDDFIFPPPPGFQKLMFEKDLI